MRFLSFLLSALLALFLSVQSLAATSGPVDLKNIYSKDDVNSLKEAFETYKKYNTENPQNLESRIKAAELVYYLSNQTQKKSEKKDYLNQGIEWAQQAINLNGNEAGGHFYYGILTGLKVEISGFITALRSKDLIRDEMLKVVELNPAYEKGDAYLALGRWYMEVPSFMGGDETKGKEYLEKVLEIAPKRTKPHLALAEYYSKKKKYDLAKKEIQAVLDTPDSAELFGPEIELDKADARALLAKIDEKLNKPLRPY